MIFKPGPKMGFTNSGFTTKNLDQTPCSLKEPSPRVTPQAKDRLDIEVGSQFFGRQFTFDVSNPALQGLDLNNGSASRSPEAPSSSSNSSSIDGEECHGPPGSEESRRASTESMKEETEREASSEFLATKYTASSEKQRDIIINNFKYFLYFMVLNLPREITHQITDPGSIFKAVRLQNTMIIVVCALLWISARLRKRFIREIIASLNYMIILYIAGFVLDIKLEKAQENEASSLNQSMLLIMIGNLLPVVQMDVVLVCFLTESSMAKTIFIGATIVLLQGILVLEAGVDFFRSPENAIFFILCMICQWFFTWLFGRTIRSLDEEKFQLMHQQGQQSAMFKRVIDSVEDAMLIVNSTDVGKKVLFKNRSATDLFFRAKEVSALEVLERKQIYPFQVEKQGQVDQEGASLLDFAQGLQPSNKSQIYTRHRHIGTCTSMAHTPLITKLKEKKAEEGDTLGFDFFLVKLIQLEESQETAPALIFQIIDISEKVCNDSLASEQRYLTFITTTVSHEMRNPLNSLLAQLANQAALMRELYHLTNLGALGDSPVASTLEELAHSVSISEAAAKLLDYNIENIVSLPKLKDKQYQKNCSLESIDEVAGETLQLMAWTAEQKGIEIKASFTGFGGRQVTLDRKGFQQVLMNYLSNAIKFMDKEEGRVRILCQLVTAGLGEQARADFQRIVSDFYGDLSLLPAEELRGSGAAAFCPPRPRRTHSIFNPRGDPLLVLSVIDNGIGIQEADQQQLYNLFSGHQQSGPMEAKGIGLGVVVSSMIANELGGTSKLYSKPTRGSVFQSSFRVRIPEVETESLANYKYSRLFKGGFPEVERIEALPSDEAKEFLQHYLEKQNSLHSLPVSLGEAKDDGLRRILIVDDEPYNCLALLTLLKSLKLKNISQRVDLCMSGKQAMKRIIQSICPLGQLPERSLAPSPSRLIAKPELGLLKVGKSKEADLLVDDLLASVREGKDLNFGVVRRAIPLQITNQSEYGLILVDCSMPFVDGYELTKCARLLFQVCGMQRLHDQPRIVAITGHFEPEFQMRAILSGMEKVFPKPMTQDVLRRVLEENGFELLDQ